MIRPAIRVCAVVVLSVGPMVRLASAHIGAQTVSEQVEAILLQFRSQHPEVRTAGFDRLIALVTNGDYRGRTWMIKPALAQFFKKNPAQEEEAKVGLIELLVTENSVVAHATRLSEEYTNYFGDLIGTVAGLQDKRAIPPLLEDVATGNMATCGLAAFGAAALDGVIARSNDHDLLKRQGMVRTLAHMVELSTVSPLDAASEARVKAALLRAVSDPEYGIRVSAVQGLAYLRDPDVVAALQSIEAHDPFFRPPEPGTAPVYVVRNAASEALHLPPRPSCR